MRYAAITAARWAIMVVFLLLLAVTVVGIARFPAYLPGHIGEFTTAASWSGEQTQAGLAQLGWPAGTIAWVELVRGLVLFNLPATVLFLLLWRRADRGHLLFIAFVFALWGSGASGVPIRVLGESIPLLAWLDDVFGGLLWQFFFMLLFFFPDGRLVPSWSRWIVGAWSLLMVASIASPAFEQVNQTSAMAFVYVAFVIIALGSQIYRYVRRSTPEQRQQTKWLVFVLALSAAYIAVVAPRQFSTPTGEDLGRALVLSLINLLVFSLAFTLPMVVIALSVLRYRLWDIDVVIRRTIVYAVLTGLLALVFYGSVILLQRLFTGVSGQSSPIVLVVSTLTIAALFAPLRNRIQAFVDRRFYRRKYDASRVLARFGAVARDETDVDALASALGAALQETMQPASLGVRLTAPDERPG